MPLASGGLLKNNRYKGRLKGVMKINPLKGLAVTLVGGSITVAVQPRALFPVAIGLAVAIAILLWNLSCGGSATLARTPRGHISFKLSGPRARRQTPAKTRTASNQGSVVPSGAPISQGQRSAKNSTRTAVAGFAILIILAVFYAVVTSLPSTAARGPRPSPHASTSLVSPAAVVEAYFAAINKRDWQTVCKLGAGKKHPQRCSTAALNRIAAGFRQTKRDVVTSIKTSGDTVSVRVRAYETTGVHVYDFSYVVHHGVITEGRTLAIHKLS